MNALRMDESAGLDYRTGAGLVSRNFLACDPKGTVPAQLSYSP